MADENDEAQDSGDESVRESLDDLGTRIAAARAGSNGGNGNGRRSFTGWIVGAAGVVIAVLLALLAGTGDDDEPEVSADVPVAVTTETTTATTAAPAPTDGTAAPQVDPSSTTTAAPETTTTAAPTTTTTAPPTTTTTAGPTTTTTAPTTTTTAPPEPEPEPQPSTPPQSPTSPAPTPSSEWTVETGDSFWAVAERLVSDQLGRAATDAEITPFWIDLVNANAERLAEPGNPDLLLPGQTMVLPPSAPVP